MREKCVSNGTVRVALAGASGYADHYLEAFLPRREALAAQLVGVVEPVPQRSRWLGLFHDQHIPVYADFQNLFATVPGIDLMLIVTPIQFHAEQTVFALERGASVLCEKPLAANPQDGLRMLEAQRRAKGFAAIGYQWSFSDAVGALKRDILSGVLGRPIRFKTIVSFPRSCGYFRRNDWAGRIRTAAGQDVFDSPANNAAAHYLHNMFYLLGPAREGSAVPAWVEAELYRANDIENYDTIALRSRTRCGVEVLFYSTHAAPERRGPEMSFQFEKATVELNVLGGGEYAGQFVARFDDGRVKCYGHPNVDRHEKIWQAIDAARGGKPVACGIAAALPHALCVDAAQKSAAAGITDFPARLRGTAPFDGEDTLVCIDGLGERLGECYDRGVLPAEHPQIDWAVPCKRVDVRPVPELYPIDGVKADPPVSVQVWPTVPAQTSVARAN